MASDKLQDNFGWVELWIKEQNFIKEGLCIESQMSEIRNAPRSLAEVRREIARFRQEVPGIDTLRGILERFQKGELASFDVETFASLKAHALAAVDIEAALKDLPEGMSVQEKEAQLAVLEAKIIEIRQKIKSECWPDSRRAFDADGRPVPGAPGDRWLNFILGWAKFPRQYPPLDFNGNRVVIDSPVHKVYVRLGLNMDAAAGPFRPLVLTCPAPADAAMIQEG